MEEPGSRCDIPASRHPRCAATPALAGRPASSASRRPGRYLTERSTCAILSLMPRPKSFDEDAVLDQAVNLFWERGYEGTSLADLETHLGLGRQSLYNTF